MIVSIAVPLNTDKTPEKDPSSLAVRFAMKVMPVYPPGALVPLQLPHGHLLL